MKVVAALLLTVTILTSAEPLVCRGFTALTAADAISSRSGRLVLVDPAQPGRDLAVWFALPNDQRPAAAQALAHALGAWWSIGSDDRLRLGQQPRLIPGRQTTRSLTSALIGQLTAERMALRLMDPWLGGNGGLVLAPHSGAWTATLDDDGHLALVDLLGLLGSGEARAPHLLPEPTDPTSTCNQIPPALTLGAWIAGLSTATNLAVALAPDLDPGAPAPTWSATTLGDVRQNLTADGISNGIFHGCLCLARSQPQDRLHPAQRRILAQVSVHHLGRTPADLDRVAARVCQQIQPAVWKQPGWAVMPVPWTQCLLIAADAPTIHAVLAELEALDAE